MENGLPIISKQDWKKTMDKKLEDLFFNSFYDMIRGAGSTPTIEQTEKLREATRQLANTIEKNSKKQVLDALKRIQDAIEDSFNNVDERLKILEDKFAKTIDNV